LAAKGQRCQWVRFFLQQPVHRPVDAGAARSKKDTVRAQMYKMLFINAARTTG
jgi:hypothetical protein